MPPIEIVTELSTSKITYPQIQTVSDGRADIWADLVGYRHFNPGNEGIVPGFPISYHPILFIYSRQRSLEGDPFTGIFDIPSYLFIGISFIILSLVIWLALFLENSKITPLKVFFDNFGSMFGQGINPSSKRIVTTSIIFLFIGSFTLLRFMYASIIMAKLTTKVEGLTINSAEDLKVHKEFRVLQVVGRLPKTEEEKRQITFPTMMPFIDRIDWITLPRFTPNDLTAFIGNISLKLTNNHILIETKAGFEFFRYYADKETICSMPDISFKKSKEHLLNIPHGWVFRRGFPWTQFLNEELMWEGSYFGIPNKRKIM